MGISFVYMTGRLRVNLGLVVGPREGFSALVLLLGYAPPGRAPADLLKFVCVHTPVIFKIHLAPVSSAL